MSRTLEQFLAVSGAATMVVVATAGAASAHVTVKPESTITGGFSQLVFRVPNESDTASTVELKVGLPTKQPLLHVSVLPVPGWTFEVTKSKLAKPVESFGANVTEAPSAVIWTATGDGVKPGEYQNFAVSAGPLPDPGVLVFPATQTYSDGDVVKWATVAKADEEEPEHPAPEFAVTATTAGHAATEAAERSAATNVESGDSNATTISVIGLIAALAALALAVVAVARGRKSQEA